MSATIPEEEFEDGYVLKFRTLLHGRGIWLEYHRDRGAIDLGIRLKQGGSSTISQTRIWFQLKGLHAETHSAAAFADKGAYADINIAHLREWYEAPEVVYLVIWVESAGEFVGLDVRDLVQARWGADVRWDEVGEPGQTKIRVWIPATNLMEPSFLDNLDRHASMRIDSGTWRGQYLGHPLDPLRNELEPMPAATFNSLVAAVLDAHEFNLDAHLDPTQILTNDPDVDPGGLAQTSLVRGRLFGTLRWPFPLSIEYGYSDIEEPREEGQWFAAHGHVAVLTMPNPGTLRTRDNLEPELVAALLGPAAGKVIVFINDSEYQAGPWRFKGLPTVGAPLGSGALSTVILLAPALHRAYSTQLNWRRPTTRHS